MYHQEIQRAVEQTKVHRTFVPSITNMVTMHAVANTQIAVGGSPAMFFLADEGISLANKCDAMYINLGTLTPQYKDLVPQTILQLEREGKKWVLDPVGLGKGQLHNALIAFIKEHPPTIIKGNASEIIKLAQIWKLAEESSQLTGVDSLDAVEQALKAATELAIFIQNPVVVSGPTDLITDGKTMVMSYGGSAWMESISGMGCMLGGVMAVYLAHSNPMIAAITAVNAFNVAGQKAEQVAQGPGTFQTHFLDSLYHLTADEIASNPMKEVNDETL